MNNLYKILVADDSEVSLRIITETLNIIGNGFELFYAHTGKEACQKALEILPDMILMDVIMPEMNGIEAVKYLRKQPSTAEIPMVVLSSTESLDKAYEAGASDFISKPFHRYELLIKVRSALNLVHKIKEVEQQRDKISQARKDLIDDINYSKRIQRAIFPNDETLVNLLPQHFLLNIPRNIVSGDFYWIGTFEDNTIIAVADCTGHGISGAFMTMAGTAFLNEILSKNIEMSASQILFELRKLVMKLLKQKGEEGEAADGMDISLIILNKERNHIQFAGANNPLYIIRNEILTLYKSDRMPIGIHLLFDKPFENHEIDIAPGDLIYLFTDGYADQFGGPNNKKFRYNQFQELLVKIHSFSLHKQKEELLRTIEAWKGNNDQVDDILVLGFKV